MLRQFRRHPSVRRRAWRLARGGIFLSCAILLPGAARLYAQEASSAAEKPKDIFELSLEDIKRLSVSAASKREQPVSQAPSSVTVLTADDIKMYGYRTLADALQSVPGFYVTSDRSRSFLGIRGFNRDDFNSRVLLLV